MSGLVLDMVVW